MREDSDTNLWQHWMDWAERNQRLTWLEPMSSFIDSSEEIDELIHEDYCYDCNSSPWDCGCTYTVNSRACD